MKVSIMHGKDIREIAEKMPNVWNRLDHPDGHILSLYELHL